MNFTRLVLLTLIVFISCNQNKDYFELKNNPKVLYKPTLSPINLYLNNIKIGDTISKFFDREKLRIRDENFNIIDDDNKNLDSLLINKCRASYSDGFEYALNYGRIQSFSLYGNSLIPYQNISKDSIEVFFGKSDEIDKSEDWDSGELLNTYFFYYKRNLKISFNDRNQEIDHISIGELPRKDLLYINKDEKQKISELDLSNLGYTEVPEELQDFRSLKILNLGKNKLSSLPDWITSLNQLENLIIEGNQIEYLPEDIGNLKNLTYVWLSDNNLTILPESFCDLTSLTLMLVNENNLSKLPEEIGNLTNLRTIYAEDNLLESIPTSIGNLEKLEYLMLTKNKLTNLPNSIQNCKKLRELYLTKNYISESNKLKIDSLLSISPWFDINAKLLKNIDKDTIIKDGNTLHFIKKNKNKVQ